MGSDQRLNGVVVLLAVFGGLVAFGSTPPRLRAGATVAEVVSVTGAGAEVAAGEEVTAGDRVPVVGLPCEGCEDVFAGIPDVLSPSARIAPPGERGEPMRIEGVVRDASGRPAVGIVVYAYHTDAAGIYPPAASAVPGASAAVRSRHGRLRGWAATDSLGRYRFDTIRPAGYPNTNLPAHVHMHVIEPECCTYYVDDIHFTDDPRLSAAARGGVGGRGGSGTVTPVRGDDGVWLVVRDLRLGEAVPGYPRE